MARVAKGREAIHSRVKSVEGIATLEVHGVERGFSRATLEVRRVVEGRV